MRPFLPSELTDRIIGLVSDDTTLLGCALVARSWIPASRSQSISESDILIEQHYPDKNSSIAELIRAPHSTVSLYLTSVALSNVGYPESRGNAEVFYDTCRAFIEAGTPFRSLRFHNFVHPLWKKPTDFGVHTFIAMASATLRSLAIINTSQTPISLNRAFFDSLVGCAVLEELTVSEDVVCEVLAIGSAREGGQLVALKTLEIMRQHRPHQISQSGPGGLGFLLDWLCQNTSPDGLKELRMWGEVDANMIHRCMESNAAYLSRVCLLDIKHPYTFEPIRVGTGFSQLHTAQFMLLVNVEDTLHCLNDLFDSLSTLATCGSKNLRKVSVFAYFGDDYTRPGLVETLRKVDIDAAFSRFANQSGSHLDISLHTKFLPSDLEPEDVRELFPLCLGESSAFVLNRVVDDMVFELEYGWSGEEHISWVLQSEWSTRGKTDRGALIGAPREGQVLL